MAKTIKYMFDKCLTFDKLMLAHKNSRKGKGYRQEIILFNMKQEEYIMWLKEQLENDLYVHGGYTVFYITEPKLRKVEKARYIDRIVHRWVVDSFLKPVFVPQFINTSYACLDDKGMHKACLDLQNAMKHCKRTWNEYYILKMDVAKCFENIDKEVLYGVISKKIKDKKILKLIKQILYVQSNQKSIEIGNYTSQMFANIYLNEIDQYAKHELKAKYYFRYLDDTVILVKTKEEAQYMLEKITGFLQENLKMKLNSKTQIIKSTNGVNFCGYKTNEYRLKLRDRGKRKLKLKIKKLKGEVIEGKITGREAVQYLAGHMGYVKYADVNNLLSKLFFTI